jgi:hypothetical protein
MVFQNVTIRTWTNPPSLSGTPSQASSQLEDNQAQLKTHQDFAALFMIGLPCISESHRSDVIKSCLR